MLCEEKSIYICLQVIAFRRITCTFKEAQAEKKESILYLQQHFSPSSPSKGMTAPPGKSQEQCNTEGANSYSSANRVIERAATASEVLFILRHIQIRDIHI